jgi:two-component system sensor kinase FixL
VRLGRRTKTLHGNRSPSLVRDIAARAPAASSLSEVVEAALEALALRNGWAVGHAFRVSNARSLELAPIAGYCEREEYRVLRDATLGGEIPLERDFPGEVARKREVRWSGNARTELSVERALLAERLGLPFVVGIPVQDDGSLAFVLEFFAREGVRLQEGGEIDALDAAAELAHVLRTQRVPVLSRQPDGFRAALAALAEPVLTVSEDGRIADVNPAAEEFFKAQRASLVGQHISRLFPELDPSLSGPQLLEDRRFAGGFESNAVDLEGRTLAAHILVSEMGTPGGGGFLLAVRDLGAIRLTHRRALRDQRLAAMAETMSALAHESRNALQRIQSCLTLLELRAGEEVQDLVDDIQEAQDQLQRLYQEVGQFVAPLELRLREVDLAALLDDVWRELEDEWRPKNLAWTRKGSAGEHSLQGDREQLQRALRNVLLNAIEASSAGGAVTAVLEPTRLHEQPALRITIEDEGAGLSEDVRRRAFDLLFTTKSEGTGMGLPVAKRIVEDHGGDIRIDSRPTGAAVTVTLAGEQLS